MKNKGPIYNLNTGKLDFPLDDRVAIGTDGKISYRIGEHTAISPNPVVNNNPVNQWEQDNVSGWTRSRPAKRSAEPSKAVMTFLQGVGVLAVIGVMAALYYYGIR